MISRDGKSNVYPTPDGTYRVRFFCSDGLLRNKVCKSKTERDALVRAIRKREELDYWFPPELTNVSRNESGTFKGLAELWLEHSLKVREISQSCYGNYRCHLYLHINPVIGNTLVKDLDLKSIEKVAALIKDKKPQTKSYKAVRKNRMDAEFFEGDEFLSSAYRREILTVACMVTKFGFERGYLAENPFREFKLPVCPEQPYDYWKLNEEDAFLDWLESGAYYKVYTTKGHSKREGGDGVKFNKRLQLRSHEEVYDIVLFALRSGLRKGEIGALTRRDVNLGTNCLMVRRSFSTKESRMKETTKGKTFRILEMNEDMRQILEKRVQRTKGDNDLLFNIHINAVKFFSRTCRNGGVKEIHFHSLRHTCLTNLANGYGMDTPLPLPQVQKIAGHKDIATTMRYVHTDGIENTTSRQWSRDRRKAKNQPEPTPIQHRFGQLKLVNSNT